MNDKRNEYRKLKFKLFSTEELTVLMNAICRAEYVDNKWIHNYLGGEIHGEIRRREDD